MKRKMQQRVIAVVMTLLMTIGLLPADFLGGKVVEVQAAEGDYTLDFTVAGNNISSDGGNTFNTGWDTTSKPGYYLFSEKTGYAAANTKNTQTNGIFSYYSTGTKVLFPTDMSYLQLDGSVNKNGQATVEFDLSSDVTGEYDLKMVYSSKGSSSTCTVKYCTVGGDLTTTESQSTSSSSQVTYVNTFAGGSAYRIGAQGGMRIYDMLLSKRENVTMTGTVSCATGTTFPDSCNVIFTDSVTGNTYTGAINTADGTYSVDIPASSIERTYNVAFSDEAYIISAGTTSVVATKTMEAANKVVDFTIQKVNTYTLSGSYTNGLEAGDVSSVQAIVFEAVTASEYAVPTTTIDTANGTYSIKLEKGTTYKVSATGVNDYALSTANFTYDVDTTLDLQFGKKTTYPITISLGSTPDLSGQSVTYTFTNKEDGYEYAFADASAIALRDGTYAVSLSGDIDKLTYKMKSGTELTVNGQAVNHPILFEEVTSWVFNASGFGTTIYEGTAGYYQGLYLDGTNGKIGGRASDTQMNAGAVIKVPVKGNCSITVTASSAGAQYALYTINGTPASTTELATTVEYTGGAGTINIVSTGTAYIGSISIAYPAEDVTVVTQPVMPYATGDDTDALTAMDTDNIPKGSAADALTIQPVGQKLNFVNANGSLNNSLAAISNVGYYVFPMTADTNVLEFDVLVTANTATGNDSGFFAGIFTNNTISTLGLRAGGTKLRGVYTKNGSLTNGVIDCEFSGAGAPSEETVGLNVPVHYTVTRTSDKKTLVTMSFVDAEGVLQEKSFSQGLQEWDTSEKVYYGFAMTNVSATITNMVYKDAEGNVLYDQNAAYTPKGAAPIASSVSAQATETREYINISWTGSVAENDGFYVVEMQKDGGEWVEIATDLTGFNYSYELPAGEGGSYLFRVCGQLGKPSLGGSRSVYATMATPVSVVAALAKPVLSVSSTASDITVSWDAVAGAEYYQVYRYSYDEGEAGATCVANRLTATTYKDSSVTSEVPYYYYVKAVSDSANNESPFSDTVWAVPTAGHTGAYVYENEATEIFITKKSYDTVFTNKATVEGVVYGDGSLLAQVNGNTVKTLNLSAKDSFALELTLDEGRNDVNLLFVDKNGKITRKTYNFVYLTNYDVIADASYTGTDGAANENGIPVYKTVQAAVDSIPADNTDSKVVLVMAGSYNERLKVTSPYVSIIGEDREATSVHCYPADLFNAGKIPTETNSKGSTAIAKNYEAGEDMTLRCAIRICSTAKNFSAENITFANDYVYATSDGKSNKSADAVRVEADQSRFVNVNFVGVQDTLYMDAGKQFYNKCRIEGLVDFIYSGEKARAFFNDCEIVFVYESTKKAGYVSAPKTAADATYGLTFNNCVITAEEGCAGSEYLLARPWGPDAYITWINCYMGKVVNELTPYNSMSGNMPEDARFFEYGTYGPGFAINESRRQISPSKAAEMISDGYLGWSPSTVSTGISSDHYVGSIVTDKDESFVTKEPNNDKYLWTDGDDTGLKMYDMEGYATVESVTGGGLLKEENDNYYKVSTAEEFLKAVLASKTTGMDTVIEIAADINLGSKEVANFADYSDVIKEYKYQPLTHPTLLNSGISQLSLEGINNLTIFSLNGSSIKHTVITVKKSENIVIRNIKFDELWEWDEATNGDYDRNDWDYITIDTASTGIWIDHCTFYKAYDGIVDIKNPSPTSNVTISWCEFLAGSENDKFFDAMMNELAANPDKYPYYKSLLDKGMTADQIYAYAYGQKKTHLLGQDDTSVNAAGIRLTLANNYYKNSMDRMPRLRYGNAHVYNCIMDAQELLDIRSSISDPELAKKIVSNGASSTCGGQILLENCYISGIENALNSGNGSSPSGYINAINSVYYMNGELTKLVPKCNSTGDTRVLITDADAFVAALPYSTYELYDAGALKQIIVPSAGAGKLNLTVLQWEKTSYNAVKEEIEVSDIEFKAEIGEIPATVLTEEVKKATGCKTVKELIAYLKAVITEDEGAKLILSGVDEKNTTAIDVTIMISFDEGRTWEKVTKENFPKNGMDVIIPYPEGTNKSDYDFVIGHLVTMGANGSVPGTMEYYKPEKTLSGLKIHINSASPFVIGWKEVEADDDYDGDTVVSVPTGDKTPIVPLAVIMLASAGVCVSFLFKKKKRA